MYILNIYTFYVCFIFYAFFIKLNYYYCQTEDHGFQNFALYFALLYLAIQPAPIAQLVECPLRGTGGHGFDPKSLKMVLAAPRLSLRFTG